MDKATVITGSSIDLYRLHVLRMAMKLEMKGMRKRGQSAFAIVKAEFHLRGSRQHVFEKFSQIVNEAANLHR